MQKLRKITSSNDGLFGAAMEIYQHSFPANERQAVGTIRTRLDDELYILYTACEDNEVLAMLLLYPLEYTEFLVIDYLAVNDRHRKKGIGAWLLREVMDDVSKGYKNKYIVLEAEDPAYGNNRSERAARVDFYKKLGAKTLEGVRYMLPPLEGNIPTEMVLMLLQYIDADSLPGRVVKDMMIQMYSQLYGRGADDELLQTFVEDVPEMVRLV